MYCVPNCRACVEAGSCPKGELPASAVRSYQRRSITRVARPRVKAIVIEKTKARVLLLVCDHYTTAETQEVYSLWRPKGRGQRRKFYCEICHEWVEAKPKPKPEPLPDVPLF